jgi:hypothetical protein
MRPRNASSATTCSIGKTTSGTGTAPGGTGTDPSRPRSIVDPGAAPFRRRNRAASRCQPGKGRPSVSRPVGVASFRCGHVHGHGVKVARCLVPAFMMAASMSGGNAAARWPRQGRAGLGVVAEGGQKANRAVPGTAPTPPFPRPRPV